MTSPAPIQPEVFLPRLTVADELASYWLRQVTWRLRREIAWLWHQRGWSGAGPPEGLPAVVDRTVEVLDLIRFADQKAQFFAADATAAYLTGLLAQPAPTPANPPPGSFGWVVTSLALPEVDAFVLALALLPVIDGSSGPVLGTCLNDLNRSQPCLSLAQRLWDHPAELLRFFNHAHPLVRIGLLPSALTWESALSVPGELARVLLWSHEPGEAPPFRASAHFPNLPPDGSGTQGSQTSPAFPDPLTIARLRAAGTSPNARLIPISANHGTSLPDCALELGAVAGIPVYAPTVSPGEAVGPLATLAWLSGAALYLPFESLAADASCEAVNWPLPNLPLTVLVGIRERSQAQRLPEALRLGEIEVPPPSPDERLEAWREGLPELADEPGAARWLVEVSRRHAFGRSRIQALCRELRELGHAPTAAEIHEACRMKTTLGELAQPVTRRFHRGDLKLPSRQSALVDDLIHAMRQLTIVHHDWGTGRAWNHAGLSALFAGPPGTGKTMAAEVIANELSLPLHRIDLSQVVNKYIGETEKNLRRVFDAAEDGDVVLLFDEADALFGKRTEVRDSHDRYANLEVSYLLERMERFKGLAILATNRRKDLDEAFLRRLRWIVEFEMPAPAERLALWRLCLPPEVDASALDLHLLAERYPLAGGHIRSVVLNACLRACEPGRAPRLEMAGVLAAIRQEYEKLGRTVDPELFSAGFDPAAR